MKLSDLRLQPQVWRCVYYYCRTCWYKGTYRALRRELETKTLRELQEICNDWHRGSLNRICNNADTRVYRHEDHN